MIQRGYKNNLNEKVATRLIIFITSIFAIYFMLITLKSTTFRVSGEKGSIGPWVFPLFIFLSILVINFFLLYSQYKNKANVKNNKVNKGNSKTLHLIWNIIPKTPQRTVEFIVILVLYVLFWRFLGFIISSTLFMWGSSLLLFQRDKLTINITIKSLIIVLIIIVSISFLFSSMFSIPLP